MPNRWQETQQAAAAWFRGHGWPSAESTPTGRRGLDITGMPGMAPEVKATAGLKPGAVKKAAGREGLAFVIYRPPGSGPATVADWPVTMRLEDITALFHAAGYGSPEARG